MTTENVSVPRDALKAIVDKCRTQICFQAYDAADAIEDILSRATPSEVPAMHRDYLKPEHAARYYVSQEEIDATHPMNTHCDTCPADNVAMILVGERHEKRNLVDLVRTLLLKAEAKPSATRVVMDEDVGRAWNAYAMRLSEYERATETYKKLAMRAALESFATSLPAAMVPDKMFLA